MCFIPASLSDWTGLESLSRLANIGIFKFALVNSKVGTTQLTGFVWKGTRDQDVLCFASPLYLLCISWSVCFLGWSCHLGHDFRASSIIISVYICPTVHTVLPFQAVSRSWWTFGRYLLLRTDINICSLSSSPQCSRMYPFVFRIASKTNSCQWLEPPYVANQWNGFVSDRVPFSGDIPCFWQPVAGKAPRQEYDVRKID